ncbi:nicotinate phosphoribosyltransferase [Roseofilum sp. BLCC_M154]|uniref:Nicotinate phosphoribosyltransferase n=1 Tax=Roseofilum acuticapitatum BLCC-M154 TaxID=3022444 RepID=A0ABT7ATA6_9CYAN|nr:nicotinate phosphoribosyltransferase [Roseofilum acuticapitatum]MDJ1170143.1 nicotinate phosphoribosyltransferase [Roseofilum acuticapitatum BLCC-M154]
MQHSLLTLNLADNSLLTDLYQLTMNACYIGEGIAEHRASFELFTRRLPPGFGYLIAMGVQPALEYLQNLQFTPDQIQALRATGIFDHAPAEFWTKLAQFRFTGDVWAVPEGTAIFANQPLLRIEAPLWQAQLVETYLLNTLNYQTLIATKAARMRDMAGEDASILEFGTRRAFSPQGALWAARAAIAGGMDATSNVLAALKLGRNPAGTMAHSLVMAIAACEGAEDAAFQAFYRYFPGAPLLIDTYDSLAAAERLAEQTKAGTLDVAGIRLDSGDLVTLSQNIRQILPQAPIFVSGDIDEYEMQRLNQAGACIDGYGIGTKLVTGSPVNGVYKLVEIADKPVMKRSTNKVSYPGRKQIFRRLHEGECIGDRLGLIHEPPEPEETPLLQPLLKAGEFVTLPDTLDLIQERTRTSVLSLPPSCRQLEDPVPVPMEISPKLQQLIGEMGG